MPKLGVSTADNPGTDPVGFLLAVGVDVIVVLCKPPTGNDVVLGFTSVTLVILVATEGVGSDVCFEVLFLVGGVRFLSTTSFGFSVIVVAEDGCVVTLDGVAMLL